ncbi:rhodanese-like domain-containing protein [Oceanospirillum sediminis]|uniref:rhodanese-like domain-containing protein n=1 Tax=Oceanospirillum sediminis TaxID=2760088 RepID=UPI0034D2275A
MKRFITLTFALIFSSCVFAETAWIDVRTDAEYSAGHVDGAIRIPYQDIGSEIGSLFQNKEQEIILYCRSGRRAGVALNTLKEMGYTNVRNVGSLSNAKRLHASQRQ